MRRHGRNALRLRLCQRDPPARENAAGSQPIDLIFGPAVFDRDVLALDQAALFQALAIGAQAFAEPVRRCASATGRGLPQRTEQTAHHDQIHHSKKTERNSALSVHAWVTPCSSSAMKPTPAPNKSGDVSNPIQTRTAGRRRLWTRRASQWEQTGRQIMPCRRQFRTHAEYCLQLAELINSPEQKASLNATANAWHRFAQEPLARSRVPEFYSPCDLLNSSSAS